MAIQTINLGSLPLGVGGDTPRAANTKINANFSDTTNAASRLIGVGAQNVPSATQAAKLPTSVMAYEDETGFPTVTDLNDLAKLGGKTVFLTLNSAVLNRPKEGAEAEAYGIQTSYIGTSGLAAGRVRQVAYGTSDRVLGETYTRTKKSYSETWSAWARHYTTANTTKEPTTGYLKSASPVVNLFNDKIEKEHEASIQDITVDKLGAGDYLLKGSTGLRNEGWNLSPPKDIHGNVLCMVEAIELDGNINIKTYKRKFDFATVAIVPDYDEPFDIPEGHCVQLRLNDLPSETTTDE